MNIRNFYIDLADGRSFFHPSVTVLPDGRWLMTVQEIMESDFYGEPAYAISEDQGRTWSDMVTIPPFVNRDIGEGWYENVADIRPFVFGSNPEVFIFGCTSIYSDKGNICYQEKPNIELPPVRAVCAILHPDGSWSRQELEIPYETDDWRTTCIQNALLSDNEVIIPFHFKTGTCMYGERLSGRASTATVKYRIENGKLEFIAMGNILKWEVKRGFCEPSLLRLPDGNIAITIRAEDGFAYCGVSSDGLQWDDIRPWRWDDGTMLETSSTQQHWVRCGKKVFLCYTRKDECNLKVMRYRSPMYIAEAVPEKATLIRATEKVLFPQLERNGVSCLYGNFHAAQLDDDNAIVSDAALFRFQEQNRRRMETRIVAALVSN